jgi:DNA-binding transcriptional regulator YiaG
MSTKLSFKEALERRDATAAVPRVNSAFPTHSFVLFANGPIGEPVNFIRLVTTHGLSIKKARQTLDRLATNTPVAVELRTDDVGDLIDRLRKLSVDAALFTSPNVDVKGVREKQGLSQSDFALLYGLEVDTLKNWEQGRNDPDGPARILLQVIEQNPMAVIDARLPSGDMAHVMRYVLEKFGTPIKTSGRVGASYGPPNWGLKTWNPEYHISHEDRSTRKSK